jgi:hypothetical protein
MLVFRAHPPYGIVLHLRDFGYVFSPGSESVVAAHRHEVYNSDPSHSITMLFQGRCVFGSRLAILSRARAVLVATCFGKFRMLHFPNALSTK